MVGLHTIIMADVISSRLKTQSKLAKDLNAAVAAINERYAEQILSPLTITLGDEFQGVCSSIDSAVQLVMGMEEHLLRDKVPFGLRYIVYEGVIDTEINTETSYGMLGDGLTNAREMLNAGKRHGKKVQFHLVNEREGKLLQYIFNIIGNISEEKKLSKYSNIQAYLIYDQFSDTEIAKLTQRTRSQIWKFRKNWNAEVYISAVNIIREGLYK